MDTLTQAAQLGRNSGWPIMAIGTLLPGVHQVFALFMTQEATSLLTNVMPTYTPLTLCKERGWFLYVAWEIQSCKNFFHFAENFAKYSLVGTARQQRFKFDLAAFMFKFKLILLPNANIITQTMGYCISQNTTLGFSELLFSEHSREVGSTGRRR